MALKPGKHSLATTLTIAGLAAAASVATAVVAPAYLMSSTTTSPRAAIQAMEAAEFGLGEILGEDDFDQMALKVGQSTVYTTTPPARQGKVQATITRTDSVLFRINVVGTDLRDQERYEINRVARLTADGIQLELVAAAQ